MKRVVVVAACAGVLAAGLPLRTADAAGPAQRWAIQATPNPRQAVSRPPHSIQSALGGVSCASATVCMAVGTSSVSLNSIPTTTLAERWEDAAWTVVATPNPSGAEFSTLAGVVCTSPTFCVAVGDAYNSATQTDASLAEIYAG